MTTPIIGAPELVVGQAIPETTVNEIVRYLEPGAGYYRVQDKDLTAPPGSPTDGVRYIVAASPTGAWAGHAKDIAIYMNTAWIFITPGHGSFAYVRDEDLLYYYTSGGAWAIFTLSGTTEATDSEMWVGTSTTARVSPRRVINAAVPVALTSGATITPDLNTGFNFSLTIAHNATLANPTNAKIGQSGAIAITQDGTGSRTLGYGTNWKFPGGAPVLSTAAGSIDVLTYYVSASGVILCNLTKAYSS